MDVHEKFIENIARTYLLKYNALGHASATEYVERLVATDPVLSDTVRRKVEEILQAAVGDKR